MYYWRWWRGKLGFRADVVPLTRANHISHTHVLPLATRLARILASVSPYLSPPAVRRRCSRSIFDYDPACGLRLVWFQISTSIRVQRTCNALSCTLCGPAAATSSSPTRSFVNRHNAQRATYFNMRGQKGDAVLTEVEYPGNDLD